MSLKIKTLLSVGALLTLPVCGWADVVTFTNASIDLLVLAGPQVEGAFTYQATVGLAWEVVNVIGNPASSLVTFFNGDDSNVGDIVNITRTGGGFFTFSSVDFAVISDIGSDQVTLTGFQGATPVDSLHLATNATFFTTQPSGFTNPIDRLQVRITDKSVSAMLMDNFVLNTSAPPLSAPEPTTLALLGLGLAGLALRRSRVGATS